VSPSLVGPDRQSDAFPLTDRADVEDCRRILFPTAPGADPDWVSEAELYDSALELAAARELEEWGGNPWEVEE